VPEVKCWVWGTYIEGLVGFHIEHDAIHNKVSNWLARELSARVMPKVLDFMARTITGILSINSLSNSSLRTLKGYQTKQAGKVIRAAVIGLEEKRGK
jgi:hypothetical protein